MEFHLKIIGILLIGLAFLHLAFPKYFNWKKELTQLSDINRQIMYVHTFFIAVVVFGIGLLCITSASELTATLFGRKISFALGVFWSARLFFQFFGYTSVVWKGKRFETTVHVLFTALWTYVSAVFFFTYYQATM